MKAHFFDLDTILVVDNKVWIIDRKNPSIPILKISQSDLNLIRRGIFKERGERFYLNGENCWLPQELANDLKIKCKRLKIDITNLGFSLREFMNSEVIGELEYEINMDLFHNIKNTPDHIYLICSKNNKKNYEKILKKIEDKLYDFGLKVEDIYYISDTYLNRDLDEIIYKKVRILLQHALGHKTEGDKFTDVQVENYDEVYYYDDELQNINIPINDFLKTIIDNTDDTLKKEIISEVNSVRNYVYMNWVSPNKVNRIQTKKVLLEYSKLIKTFESFRYLKGD